MAKKAKPPGIVMTDGKWEIIRQLLSEYDIKTAEDIQDALKDLLGYEKTARSDSDNARNIRSTNPSAKRIFPRLIEKLFQCMREAWVRDKFRTLSKNFKALKFPTVL